MLLFYLEWNLRLVWLKEIPYPARRSASSALMGGTARLPGECSQKLCSPGLATDFVSLREPRNNDSDDPCGCTLHPHLVNRRRQPGEGIFTANRARLEFGEKSGRLFGFRYPSSALPSRCHCPAPAPIRISGSGGVTDTDKRHIRSRCWFLSRLVGCGRISPSPMVAAPPMAASVLGWPSVVCP